MKRTRRVNVDLGHAEATREGVLIVRSYRSGKQRVEYSLNTDSPYVLAWLARAAIDSLEKRKTEIENALKVVHG